MFTGTLLDTPDKKMSKKQKAHRTKSMVELDKLIRELEKIQQTTPLMFVDHEASMDAAATVSADGTDFGISNTNSDVYNSTTTNDVNGDKNLSPPKNGVENSFLAGKYEIPEPKFDHRYLVPTVSSSLPIYLQGEAERIRTSFRSHTCWTIKKLPNLLMTGEVQRIRRQHAVENLVSTSSNTFKPASLLKARDFDKPEYIGTDFDKMKNLNKIQVEQEKIRIDSYSRRPFVVSSRIRAKFEDIFNDDGYQFAYMGPGGDMVNAITRGGGSSGARSGGDGSSSQGISTGITPKNGGKYDADLLMIKTWVTKIHKQIAKDWPMFCFRIRYTPTQEILIQFAYPKSNGQGATQTQDGTGIIPPFPPPNNALNKYMHQLASHGLASQFNLAKRGDRWHVVERDWNDSSSTVNAASTSSPFNNMMRQEEQCEQDDGEVVVVEGIRQKGVTGINSSNNNGVADGRKDTGRDTNNSSLTSSGGSHPNTSQPLQSSSSSAAARKYNQAVPGNGNMNDGSQKKQSVVLTEGGLLEADPDGNQWFRPLPHYHHFHDEQHPPNADIDEKVEGNRSNGHLSENNFVENSNQGDTLSSTNNSNTTPPSVGANNVDLDHADSPSKLKKVVSFSKLAEIAKKDQELQSSNVENAEEGTSDFSQLQTQQQQAARPALRRRLSSSMPLLETMLEETSSQLSSKGTSLEFDQHIRQNQHIPSSQQHQPPTEQLSGSLEDSANVEEAKFTDYLTFSFYTPWVSCRQTNTAKFYAQQDRFLAREKLRQRQEKQAKLLSELDAAIAEEKARNARRQHHHQHHNHHHRDQSGLPAGIGAAHSHYGSISAMPSSSFSLTDTFLSGLNAAAGGNGANGISSTSSASSQPHSSNNNSHLGSHASHHPMPILSRQASSSSSISALANMLAQQQGRGASSTSSSFSNQNPIPTGNPHGAMHQFAAAISQHRKNENISF